MGVKKKNQGGRAFLHSAACDDNLREQLSGADNDQELLKLASAAGFTVSNHDVSAAMRSIAADSLEKHGLPAWAINSMFAGEAVCW